MSPRWGFKYLRILCCYKHAAPLGLCWFTSSLVHWLIELINPIHCAPLERGDCHIALL